MSKVLTISVAAYNVESTLAEALDSMIVESIMQDLEVIIVNDGSKDRTLEIAQSYQERYPDTFIVVNKKNGGHGSTINASLKIARGKYYKIVDGDDWINTKKLFEFVEFLKLCDADIVTTGYIEYYISQNKVVNILRGTFFDSITRKIEEVIDKRGFCMHELTVRTNVLTSHNIHITENCFYVDREYMQFSLAYSNSIAELDYCIYRYRLGSIGQSVSPENRVKRIENQKSVLYRLLSWYDNEQYKMSEKKKKFVENDLAALVSYVIESYSYFKISEYKDVKRNLCILISDIQTKYKNCNISKRKIAFFIGSKMSVKKIIRDHLVYFMLCTNFCGLNFYMLIQKRKISKY